MSAEKSKAEVLNKLARKYSPTHLRPGLDTPGSKSSKFSLASVYQQEEEALNRIKAA